MARTVLLRCGCHSLQLETGVRHVSSITQIPTTSADVLAFEAEGEIRPAEVEEIRQAMDHLLTRHRLLNLLILFRSSEEARSTPPGAPEFPAADARSFSGLGRCAVVGAADGPETSVELLKHVLPEDTRHFGRHEAHDAWEFVGASPRPPAANAPGHAASP